VETTAHAWAPERIAQWAAGTIARRVLGGLCTTGCGAAGTTRSSTWFGRVSPMACD